MRIYYCLTSIELDNQVPRSVNLKYANAITDEKLQFLRKYAFTMIEITEQNFNFVEYSLIDGLPEKYFYFIFERNGERKKIQMKPGSIRVKNVDKKDGIIDLEFGSYQLDYWNPHFQFHQNIKGMRIRNIKHTPNQMLTEDEKSDYQEYLSEIDSYMAAHLEKKILEISLEEAMNKNIMKMSGTRKVLLQKMTDIKDAIEFFCDPTKVKIDEIPEDNRFIGKTSHTRYVEIETQNEYHWRKNKPKDTWNYLIFDHVKMPHFDDKWFDAINLTTLKIKDCTFINISERNNSVKEEDWLQYKQKTWEAFAYGIEKLEQLKELQISANLTDIPDIVFQKLPKSITTLTLCRNQLKILSPDITCLTKLHTLDLDDNVTLTEIPWNSLPKTIKWFLLENTGISVIPKEVERLISLSQLGLKKTNLQNVAWNSLAKTIHSMALQRVGNLNEIINAPQISSLEIHNTDLKDSGIESILSNLPNVTVLTLKNTNLDVFNCSDLWFNDLDLSDNHLTDFPWECIRNFRGNGAKRISLDLSNNKITVLGSPNNWRNLENLNIRNNKIEKILMENFEFNEEENHPQMSLDLSNNEPLTFIPVGFEKLVNISQMSISGTLIGYEDIEETLWKRLPPSLTVLNLNGLPISTLPCILKNFALKELFAAGCNLKWICPQLSKNPNLQYLDISKNPSLESFSFVPQKPYLYPRQNYDGEDVEFTEGATGVTEGIKIPPVIDYSVKPLKILADKVFRNTERAPVKNLHFKFDVITDEEPNGACLCCARCGEQTHTPLVQQLMTMDIDLYQFNDSKIKEDFEWNRDLWNSKKWKSKVRTRLCEGCKEWFKIEAKKVVEKHRKKMEKTKETSGTVKRKPAESERKTKKIKVPGEEDSDDEEESEEGFESEDSVLSEGDSDDETDKVPDQFYPSAPLEIGSTITLSWPPIQSSVPPTIPQYLQPSALPSINTIYGGQQHPHNIDYHNNQSRMSFHEPMHDTSFNRNNEQSFITSSSDHFQKQHQAPQEQQYFYTADGTLVYQTYVTPQQQHDTFQPLQNLNASPNIHSTFQLTQPQTAQHSQLQHLPAIPTNSFQSMNISSYSNQTYFEPQQFNQQQPYDSFSNAYSNPNIQQINPNVQQQQNMPSEFFDSRTANDSDYRHL